tara:strand:+ start:482 stop:1465 length:984 start_codon:yes stop_codon:yes gene_type:complete
LNEEFYISLVGEAFDGYTECDIEGKPVFLKHVSIKDQRYVHKYFEKYKQIALDRGLETQEQRLKYVLEEEIWEQKDDEQIYSLENQIENLKRTVKATFLPSQRENLQEDINKKRKEVESLRIKRQEVIGKTAEDYATSRSGDELLRCLLYDSDELKNNFYTDEQFGDLETWEVIKISKLQDNVNQRFADSIIQEAVLRPFFSMYLSSCENISQFYGKPVIDLTIPQLKVATYGRMFFNIFQNVPDIPDNIKEDPQKLMAFSDSYFNKDKNSGGLRDDADASAVFGATKEDMKTLNAGPNTVSLSDELKKSGGQLNMEQMMRLAGHDV